MRDSGGEREAQSESVSPPRFPVLGAFDLCLKCSHLFNILDARGAISVTERVGVIARVRALAVAVAKAWVDQQKEAVEAVARKPTRLEREQLAATSRNCRPRRLQA